MPVCLAVTAPTLIPHPPVSRLAFLGCGGLVSITGVLLLASSRTSEKLQPSV